MTPEERAREIIGFHDTPPCDCIKRNEDLSVWWRPEGCYCRNQDDAAYAESWCTEANLEKGLTAALRSYGEEQRQAALAEAVKVAREFDGLGKPVWAWQENIVNAIEALMKEGG